MPHHYRNAVRVLVCLGVGFALAGCVTSKKYRLAKEGVPPATALGWKATVPSAELTLESVIIFKGPGSWKREARWDEYVVKLENRGADRLHLDSVELFDVLGQPQGPGSDPWQLEKLSYTNWDKYGKTGLKLLAGAGAVTLYAGAAMATAMSGIAGGASAGGAVVLLDVIPIVALVDVTAVAVINHQNKGKVQAEFDRRRLVLPLAIEPRSSIAGSFFFPMTPGPQRLVVKGQTRDTPIEFVLELKPLAALHLKPPDKK